MGNKIRHVVQAIWTVATNSYLVGFFSGKIFKGDSKKICVPGLNCYSCPGAVGACPVGSLQSVIGSWKFKISFYIMGFLLLVGAVFGRFVCGWLCPFGLVQDLLHKIPFPKRIKGFKWDKPLRYLKYIILGVFVILLPMFLVDIIGQGSPYFCKYICPSGTLFGGWLIVLANKPLQAVVGWLFLWKNVVLIMLIVLSIVIYRPFCKYVCPLGAIYAVLNPISFYKMKVDEERCTRCRLCSKACKMNIEPYKTPNHPECIRCGDCKKACPHKAIKSGIIHKQKNGAFRF